MDLILTAHAQKRMNQRSISKEMVELIYEYGREEYDNNGGIRIIITKNTATPRITPQDHRARTRQYALRVWLPAETYW